ncbi:MAG: hypothetical protein JL56_04590 [Desulfotomaculum sp. BICA1-6]|nr:MAG: hypothetical protein JL56_04590 [Desulfotomaculum sp. BICA1-6]
MKSPFELISQLEAYGVALRFEGGRVRVKLPWPPDKAPEDVKPLLREMKMRQPEVLALLLHTGDNNSKIQHKLTIEEVLKHFGKCKLWDLPDKKVSKIEEFFNTKDHDYRDETYKGAYLKDLYGLPYTRKLTEWKQLFSYSLRQLSKAILKRDQLSRKIFFLCSCYFGACMRFLKGSNEEIAYRHILQELRFPDEKISVAVKNPCLHCKKVCKKPEGHIEKCDMLKPKNKAVNLILPN